MRRSILAREERHRRAVLLGIGLLLFLGMSPILGHHVGSGLDSLLAGTDHIGRICLIALHYLLAPVHDLFHLLFACGLLYAVGDRLRAWRLTRRTLSALPARAPAAGDAFHTAALAAGVDPGRMRIVTGLPTPAFTAGWARPRIFLAAEVERELDPAELAAVIAHEGAHLARRDPLRLSALRFMAHALFWIPALHRLAEDCADEAEIRADDAASADRPLVLASALLALAQWGQPRPALRSAVGFDDRDLLERRVRRLAGEAVPPRTHLTRSSLLMAAVALALVWATGTVMAHPLPGAVGHPEHCEHADTSPWSHLMCMTSAAREHEVCPHFSL